MTVARPCVVGMVLELFETLLAVKQSGGKTMFLAMDREKRMNALFQG